MWNNVRTRKLIASALEALLISAITPLLIIIYTVLFAGNSVEYFISESEDSLLYSIIVENHRDNSSEVTIGFPIKAMQIIASSGISSPSIQNDENRRGSLLLISKIPPSTSYSLIVRAEKTSEPYPKLSLIDNNLGFIISKSSPITQRLNTYSLIFQFVFLSIFLFILDVRIAVRFQASKAKFDRDLDELQASIKRNLEKIDQQEKENKNVELRAQRALFYYSRLNAFLEKRNEYWQSLFERIITADGVTKGDARRLMKQIFRSLGINAPLHDPAENLSAQIEFLVDEEKRAAFENAIRPRVDRKNIKSNDETNKERLNREYKT